MHVFDLDALGIFTINDEGLAGDFMVTAFAGLPGDELARIASLSGEFRAVFNTTVSAQEVKVPQRFIDEDYLPPDFVASLTPSQDDPDRKVVLVPAGPPKLDGTFGPAGPYAVMQGQGTLQLVEVFSMQGSFRVEVSGQGLFMSVDAGLELDYFGQANALGFLEITAAGLVAAVSVDLDLPTLCLLGVDLTVDAQLVINTTDETRSITDFPRRLADVIRPESQSLGCSRMWSLLI